MSEAVASSGLRALRMLGALCALMTVLVLPNAGAQTPPTDFSRAAQVVRPPPRTMPSLRGTMYEEAAGAVRRRFDVAVEAKYGPGPADVPTGAVYDQDPQPGAPVKSPVTLFVSTGPPSNVPEPSPQPSEEVPVPPPVVEPPTHPGPGTRPVPPDKKPAQPVPTMSNLIGKTLVEAKADPVIREYKIRINVSERSGSSYYETGRIYEQSPREGERINQVVLVHVSTGPARMPPLIGMTFEEAQQILHRLGSRGTYNDVDSPIPKGRIYDQWPKQGEPLAPAPKLYVSTGVPPQSETAQPRKPDATRKPDAKSQAEVIPGPQPIPQQPVPPEPTRRVPPVIGKPQQEAIGLIDGEHATASVSASEPSRYPRGWIARSDPLPGEMIPAEGPIFIFPSNGMNKVPPLSGGSVDDATRTIEQNGFHVDGKRYVDSERPKGEVLSSDPPTGDVVAVGTGVNLQVSAGPAMVMPDVTGIPLERARGRFEENDLAPVISVRRRVSLAWPNHVVDQAPAANAKLATNRPSVTLWVSYSLAWILAVTGAATLGSAATAKALWPRLKVSLDLSTATAQWQREPDVIPEVELQVTLEPGEPPAAWSAPIIEETRHG